MHAFAAAGAGFLLAVLWFDLMFDVQTRKHSGGVLPPEVLGSISAYYRRVTTEAYPMNRLVALVMLLTLAAIWRGDRARRKSVVDRLGLTAVGGKRFRAYDDAHGPQRAPVGKRARTRRRRSPRLARAVCRDHMLSFARMGCGAHPAADRMMMRAAEGRPVWASGSGWRSHWCRAASAAQRRRSRVISSAMPIRSRSPFCAGASALPACCQ